MASPAGGPHYEQEYPHIEWTSLIRWDPSSDHLIKRGRLIFPAFVLLKSLATDHSMRNVSRLDSAVNSLQLMHAYPGQEDGSLADHLVAADNIADDDIK
jgi:hypothetical protein